jgi:hypothetical protein
MINLNLSKVKYCLEDDPKEVIYLNLGGAVVGSLCISPIQTKLLFPNSYDILNKWTIHEDGHTTYMLRMKWDCSVYNDIMGYY